METTDRMLGVANHIKRLADIRIRALEAENTELREKVARLEAPIQEHEAVAAGYRKWVVCQHTWDVDRAIERLIATRADASATATTPADEVKP